MQKKGHTMINWNFVGAIFKALFTPGKKDSTEKAHINIDQLSQSARNAGSVIGKGLRFLFTTKAGWILMIVLAIAGYGLHLRNSSPTELLVEQNGVAVDVMPWSGKLFQDWASPEHYISSTIQSTEWKVVVRKLDNGAEFEYFVMDEMTWLRVDEFKYKNGESYETTDGRTVIFQSDDSGWGFVSQ